MKVRVICQERIVTSPPPSSFIHSRLTAFLIPLRLIVSINYFTVVLLVDTYDGNQVLTIAFEIYIFRPRKNFNYEKILKTMILKIRVFAAMVTTLLPSSVTFSALFGRVLVVIFESLK